MAPFAVAAVPKTIVPPVVVLVPSVPGMETSIVETPVIFGFSRVIVPPVILNTLPTLSLTTNTWRLVPVVSWIQVDGTTCHLETEWFIWRSSSISDTTINNQWSWTHFEIRYKCSVLIRTKTLNSGCCSDFTVPPLTYSEPCNNTSGAAEGTTSYLAVLYISCSDRCWMYRQSG